MPALIIRDAVSVKVEGFLGDAPFDFILHMRCMGTKSLADKLKDDNLTLPDFLTPLIEGWDGVFGDGGQALEFNAQNLAQLLDVPHMPEVIFRAWSAQQGARAKN